MELQQHLCQRPLHLAALGGSSSSHESPAAATGAGPSQPAAPPPSQQQQEQAAAGPSAPPLGPAPQQQQQEDEEALAAPSFRLLVGSSEVDLSRGPQQLAFMADPAARVTSRRSYTLKDGTGQEVASVTLVWNKGQVVTAAAGAAGPAAATAEGGGRSASLQNLGPQYILQYGMLLLPPSCVQQVSQAVHGFSSSAAGGTPSTPAAAAAAGSSGSGGGSSSRGRAAARRTGRTRSAAAASTQEADEEGWEEEAAAAAAAAGAAADPQAGAASKTILAQLGFASRTQLTGYLRDSLGWQARGCLSLASLKEWHQRLVGLVSAG
jgi:hypothetical protein